MDLFSFFTHTIKHEDASVMMFKHLIKVNDLKEEMKIHGLKNKDITFIEEMIKGVDVASNEVSYPIP